MLCKVMQRKYVTQIAFLLSANGLFLFGPSMLLGYPDVLGMCIAGVVGLGVSVAFIFVPLLSEIIAAV